MSKHVSHSGRRQSALARVPMQAAALLAGLALAACSHMPGAHEDGQHAVGKAGMAAAPMTGSAQAPAAMSTGKMEVTATDTLSCVPTKEAQALGLVRTEEVQAVYQLPADNEAGDAIVVLKFGQKEYTLHEGPAASGSRYVTTDTLSPRYRGFSWHSKRNEAIVAGLEAGSGSDDLEDGPLLYRCLQVN